MIVIDSVGWIGNFSFSNFCCDRNALFEDIVTFNQTKSKIFGDITEENIRDRNWLLTIPLPERRKLTIAKIETSLMSALPN
jgi:hypothetical protein